MEKRISGYTGLMGLFGSPVGHSASPEMYNFCFQHDGLDYAYLAFDVKAEDMPETIKTIRLLKMRGGNFTMPCKNIGAKLMDRLSPAAQLVGACNAFVNEEGVLTGYITDGIGFVKNLKEHGVEVKGKKILVLGAGGAATAIQVQLALFHQLHHGNGAIDLGHRGHIVGAVCIGRLFLFASLGAQGIGGQDLSMAHDGIGHRGVILFQIHPQDGGQLFFQRLIHFPLFSPFGSPRTPPGNHGYEPAFDQENIER